MSQVYGKAINFPPHWDPEVVDLIKGMTRPVPHERLNIHQIINHPALKKHLDDFKKPITKCEYDIMVRNFILNLQGNHNREVPEVIARELMARKSHSTKSDRQTPCQPQSQSLINFFDDIQEIKKTFFNDLDSDVINYEPKTESKRNILGASSSKIIPLHTSLYDSNRSFFSNQIVPVVDDNFTCDFPSAISTRDLPLHEDLKDSNSDPQLSQNGTIKEGGYDYPIQKDDNKVHESNKNLPFFAELPKVHGETPLFTDFVKKNTKKESSSKLQSVRSSKLARSANIVESRVDAEINRESIFHGKPVPIIIKASQDRKQVLNFSSLEPKVVTVQPVAFNNSDRPFQKTDVPFFKNESQVQAPIRVNNAYPNFAPPNHATLQQNSDFVKKLVANDSTNYQPHIPIHSGQKLNETVLQQSHVKVMPYLITPTTQVHQVFGQKAPQQFIKNNNGFTEAPMRNPTDLSHVRFVTGPVMQTPTMRVRTLSASRLLQEPTSHINFHQRK